MARETARLSIDIPVEERRRIRVAAARRDQSIREFVREAIAERLRRERPGSAAGLKAASDPVLAELWDNPADAVYDTL